MQLMYWLLKLLAHLVFFRRRVSEHLPIWSTSRGQTRSPESESLRNSTAPKILFQASHCRLLSTGQETVAADLWLFNPFPSWCTYPVARHTFSHITAAPTHQCSIVGCRHSHGYIISISPSGLIPEIMKEGRVVFVSCQCDWKYGLNRDRRLGIIPSVISLACCYIMYRMVILKRCTIFD